MKLSMKVKIYLNSFSTKLAIFIGIVMYFSYAFKEQLWTNFYLIGVSLFIGIFLPHFTKFVDSIERKFSFLSGSVFLGKIGRFIPQLLFNLVVLKILVIGDVIHSDNLNKLGGAVVAAVLTTLASQGLQYITIALSNRDMGNRYANVTIALSLNSIVTALAVVGFSNFQKVFVIGGILLGIIGVFYSLITDIMAFFAPNGGIGIFFGTFNPVHKTHIELVKRFMEERKLEKVFIHPTVVPKGHQKLLKDQVIEIVKMEGGMRFYERTKKADVHVNYFPTGNKFYEIENRIIMLKAAIRDYGLEGKVEVICYPEIYSKEGFYGIINMIKKQYKGKRIHGLHGSDVGGMLVRAIYDESFRIWSYPIRRKDNISATAIRNGAVGMTSKTTSEILEFLRKATNNQELCVFNKKYKFIKHRLVEDN